METNDGSYQPSDEEIKDAEAHMTEEEKKSSLRRNTLHNIAEDSNDSNFFRPEESDQTTQQESLRQPKERSIFSVSSDRKPMLSHPDYQLRPGENWYDMSERVGGQALEAMNERIDQWKALEQKVAERLAIAWIEGLKNFKPAEYIDPNEIAENELITKIIDAATNKREESFDLESVGFAFSLEYGRPKSYAESGRQIDLQSMFVLPSKLRLLTIAVNNLSDGEMNLMIIEENGKCKQLIIKKAEE